MSGKPNKKSDDMVKNRQEYLDNLALTIENQNLVEQAVKLYKETAQVMPVSQMKDTRSTADKLLDVEKLKIELIKDFSEVSDVQFAQDVVQRLFQSPLNIDNKLFIFAAQRSNELVTNIKKYYKYGIKGDVNDAEQFVNFINKQYTDKQKITDNSKEFMSRMGVSSGGATTTNTFLNPRVKLDKLYKQWLDMDQNYKTITKTYLEPRLEFLRNALRQRPYETNTQRFIDLEEKRQDFIRINQKIARLIRDYLHILPQDDYTINNLQQMAYGTERLMMDAEKEDLQKYLYFLNNNIPNIDYLSNMLWGLQQHLEIIKNLTNGSRDFDIGVVITEYIKINDILLKIQEFLDQYPRELETAVRAKDNITAEVRHAQMNPAGAAYAAAYPQIPVVAGHGLPSRMRGQGFQSKVDTTQGIEPSPRYIKFGRYVINNKKLNDNVISLRRNKGSQISSIPSYRGSENLGRVVKTIVGGGNPSFEDLNKLTEEEKKYLYKVSQEADIFDKIKIPTPSKDQEEKDIHQFNVMKGEIMAGNDSKELVHKFKVLLLKLSRQNILPKNQVSEIMEELLEMGY